MVQNSDEWFLARMGKFTSSQIYRLMKSGRGKDEYFGKVAYSYIGETVSEILTGERKDFSSKATEWGHRWEPSARERYEFETGRKVTLTGFVQDPKFDYVGGSPDGLVGAFGQIEIKCPHSSDVHLKYLQIKSYADFESAVKDNGYDWQIQNNMRVVGSEWCDFVSFDPRFDWNKQIKIFRVEKNAKMWEELEERLSAATEELLKIKYTVG